MTEQVKEQILNVRETGEANMFDTSLVQSIAFNSGYNELVLFLKEHRKEYATFILTGKYQAE